MPSVPNKRFRTPIIRPRDELLTLRQAAEKLGISRHTLYVRAALGKIPARKIGRMFVIRRKDLEPFIRDRDTKAVSAAAKERGRKILASIRARRAAERRLNVSTR